MKYLAHIKPSLDSEIISIYDVYNGKNSRTPEKWDRREYYSLGYLTPMIARVASKKTKPHFAFKNGLGGNENSGGGESIEHDLSKKTVFDLKKLWIRMWGKEGYLYFSEMKIEYQFANREVIADLYSKIENENGFGYPVNSFIAIELHWKNKVSEVKREYYRKNNIAAIEIDLNKSIQFDGDLGKLQARTIGYFQKPRPTISLHDPNYIQNKIKRDKVLEDRKQKEQELKRIEKEHVLAKAIIMQEEKVARSAIPVITKPVQISNSDYNEIPTRRSGWLNKISRLLFGKK